LKTLFLQGYSLSIKVKNTRLVFTDGVDIRTGKQDKLEQPVSRCNFDKVIIQGKGFISTEALERLAEGNINVVMLDKRGKLYSYFHQIGGSNEPLIRQRQYDCFRDEKNLEYLRKWIVSQKIESQIWLFKDLTEEPKRYYNSYNKKWQINNNQHSSFNYSLTVKPEVKLEVKRVRPFMERHLALLPKAKSLREIMKVEADVGKRYYPTFALTFKPELGFTSRNSRRTFRPSDASDVINALLNYGSSILYAEIATQLNALGFDCYVGFYHISHSSHLPLVFDIIEPFRHLLDRSVLEIQGSIRKSVTSFPEMG
jgi:CRISP-associated protein Cas1